MDSCDIRIVYIEKLKETEYVQKVWRILCDCDRDFYPPLSARTSSSQSNLENEDALDPKPYRYFERMSRQHFLIALNDQSEPIGFMTFIHDYGSEDLERVGKSNYITTICVEPAFRGIGILGKLYDFMEKEIPADTRMNSITTRTWSQNEYHLRSLKKRGYEVVKVLQDHRGPGVDTLYFCKNLT